MANTEIIDSIVDPKAEQQVESLKAQLAELNKQFIDTARGAAQMLSITGRTTNIRQFQQTATQAAIATERLAREQNNNARSAIQLQQAQARLTQQQQRNTQATQAALSPYQQLTRQYKAATDAARDAGVQFGVTSTQFTQAAQRANGLRSQLDAIDQPLGNFQRNVGNYSNAFVTGFNRAFGAVRTIANILPGLGISGIFLLAYEGIIKAAEALDLFSSKLSQTQLNQQALNEVNHEANRTAGEQITRLKYLYIAATDVNNSTKNRKEAVNELQREFPNYFKNISDETILNGGARQSYDDLSGAIIRNARAMASANKIAELQSKILDADVAIQKIRNAEVRENIELQKDIASGKFSLTGTGEAGGEGILEDKTAQKIHQRAVQAVKDQNDLKKGYQNTIDVLQKLAGGATALGNALAGGRDNTDTPKKGRSQEEILNERLKAVKLANERIQADQTKSDEEKLQSTYDFERKSEALILDAQNRKVISQLDSSNRSSEIEKEGNKQRLEVQKRYEKELEDEFNRQLKAATDHDKALLASIKTGLEQRQQAIIDKQAEDEERVTIAYKNGEISEKTYQKRLLGIQHESNLNQLQEQLNTAKELIRLKKEANPDADTSSEEATVTDVQRKINNERRKIRFEGYRDEIDERKKLKSAIIDLARQTQEALKSIINAGFENQIQAIEKQKQAVADQAEAEKAAVERSLDTQNNKVQRQKVIDAKAKAQTEQLAREQAEIRRRQAIADRAFTVAKIIADTASAVVEVLPNYILAAIVGATGAAALATVLAAPLPSYRKGTDNHPGGYAKLHDNEMVILPNGGSFITSPTVREEIYNLPKGTQVKTKAETMQIIKPEKLVETNARGERPVIVNVKSDNKLPKAKPQDWRNIDRRTKFKSYADRRFK